MRIVLKQDGNWVLECVQRTEYAWLKSGRGTVRLRTNYQVVCQDNAGMPILGQPCVFHLTSKAVALKHFRIVTDRNLDALQRCNAIDSLYGRVIGE